MAKCFFPYLNAKSNHESQNISASHLGETSVNFRPDYCYYEALAVSLRSCAMKTYRLVQLTSLLALHISVALSQDSCLLTKIAGVIQADLASKTTAFSDLHCFLSGCRCLAQCLSSFGRLKTEECVISTVAFRDLVLSYVGDKDWVTFASRGPTDLLLPVALWSMDNVVGVRNFGTKGPRLDMTRTALRFDRKGPRGAHSDLMYSRFDGSVRPDIRVRHGGEQLLDITRPFMIGVWIKSDPVLVG